MTSISANYRGLSELANKNLLQLCSIFCEIVNLKYIEEELKVYLLYFFGAWQCFMVYLYVQKIPFMIISKVEYAFIFINSLYSLIYTNTPHVHSCVCPPQGIIHTYTTRAGMRTRYYTASQLRCGSFYSQKSSSCSHGKA